MGKLADFFGAPMRILLVEDDPETAAEFCRVVDESADDLAVVSRTASEVDVPRLLQQIAVDAVLLDETTVQRTWQQVARDILKVAPATRIVLHTEHPSEHLLDECVRHGVRRPLRKHLPLERLLEEMESLVEDERRLKMRVADAPGTGGASAAPADWGRARGAGQVIVVASGFAGGAGKTTLAANTAIWLANHPAFPQRVALLDLERGRGSMRSLFDPLAPPKPSVLDLKAWAGYPQVPPETLAALFPRDGVAARKFHLALMFGSGDYGRDDEVTAELIQTVITSLRLAFQVVVVDLPGDVTDAALGALRLATSGLWLVRADMRDFDRHADILRILRTRAEVDLARFQSLLTMVPPGLRPAYTPEHIRKALNLPVLPWALPYDPKVAMAQPGRFPAMEDRDGPYMRALRKVVEEICPETRTAGAMPAATARGAGRGASPRPRGTGGGVLAGLFGRKDGGR